MSTIDKIAQRTRRTTFLAAKNLYWHIRPGNTDRKRKLHLFVAGVQRSGTNMLMDILEKSWVIDAYHERDERAFDNYKMRELPVIKTLAEKSPMPLFVIKALFELQDLPSLMQQFSPAKTIWIVRDYNDTVNSTIRSFKHDVVGLLTGVVLDSSPEWLGRGLSEKTLATIKGFVDPQMTDEDAAAIQWYMRNILFFEMNFDQNENVLAVSYEQLVTEPEHIIDGICNFIDIPYESRLSKGIFSSSVGKTRKPEISPAIEKLCAGLKAMSLT
ncbi:MAG: sulfotransferase family protein [Gammaproteobacteria bacterium]|nr:MAG: sulfotransferase family protein [Gammaproteobacteria bacterium]